MGKLTGKVAVVTGASKGIGAGIAAKLGAEGANVVVNYASDRTGAQRVAKSIEAAGGRAIAVGADLSTEQGVHELFEEVKKTFGTLDILVNNAGVYEFRPLEEVDAQHFHKHFNLNVLGLLLATKEAVKIMNGEGGSIINVSSVGARTPVPSSSVYTATKGAVDTITRALALELGPRKIRVNSLSPGVTESEGTHTLLHGDSVFREQAISRTPLGRIGTVEDVANAAAFLASPDSGWVTGEELLVGGGIRF